MFAAAGEAAAAQREFIEALKRATLGVEKKRLARLLDEFLDERGNTFLSEPEAWRWGAVGSIWPEGRPWLAAAGRRGPAAAERHTALPWVALNEKQGARLHDFFAALPEWSPGAPLPGAVNYLVGNALKIWHELNSGAARVEMSIERKKVAFEARARDALVNLVAGTVGAELGRSLERTRGLFAARRGDEVNYHAAVRRAGRLTLADVLRLLLPGTEEQVRALSSGVGEGRRAAVDRLTARREV